MLENLPSVLHGFTKTVGSSLIMLALCAPFLLKVTGVIDWSWRWVFAPFWMLFGLLTVIALLGGLAYLGYLIVRLLRR